MEGEGCQPTASEPSEILASGSVKVRLPSVASMTGSVFTESHHAEAGEEAAYRQENQSLDPATTSTVIRAPKRDSSKFNVWYLLSCGTGHDSLTHSIILTAPMLHGDEKQGESGIRKLGHRASQSKLSIP